jgi:hypothetical protein
LNAVDVNAQVWSLEANQIVKRASTAPLSERGGRLRQICQQYAVQKMDSTATGVYVFGGDEQGGTTVGHIALDGPSLLRSQRGDAIGVAGYDDVVFACYDDAVTGSEEQTLLTAAPGERFMAIECVDAAGPVLALLVDVPEGQDMPNRELRIFRIEP